MGEISPELWCSIASSITGNMRGVHWCDRFTCSNDFLYMTRTVIQRWFYSKWQIYFPVHTFFDDAGYNFNDAIVSILPFYFLPNTDSTMSDLANLF
jgi:hypothetical protein